MSSSSCSFEPVHENRRKRLEELRCWDGQVLPPRLKKELAREIDRLELAIAQLGQMGSEPDLALRSTSSPSGKSVQQQNTSAASPGTQLLRLRSIGPEIASVLSLEAFYRNFRNRREIGAYSGLAPSPWQSRGIDVEQGISKAGNARLRRTMIQLGWLWLRH